MTVFSIMGFAVVFLVYRLYFQTPSPNPPEMAVEQLVALIEVFFACFLLGSLYVPVKRFNPGDGKFFLKRRKND